MKDLIIESIVMINRRKTERNIVPNEATEYELKLEIMDRVYRKLDEMINEGIVIVAGETIHKEKLLKSMTL